MLESVDVNFRARSIVVADTVCHDHSSSLVRIVCNLEDWGKKGRNISKEGRKRGISYL